MSKNSNKKNNSKKRFELQQGETIDQCLARIEQEGYTPIRRTEVPVFQEINKDGVITYDPVSKKVVFETVPL
ncbi:NETI motif-containing protein [Aquibacillus halophilus]|uniref:NETI motif-containing protein n=1 Tax=Aquibacillus halophilus TaxID=930132 RepID=A0A6A8DUM1_9BACI|nr:NETI motif-containing protein [Aquibacillus halophilus]MRH44902.1 NETI motif-containing protein [Aquibacillus halophilus]